MSLSAVSLYRLAGETGFRVELLEKVDRLVELLQALFDDAFLGKRLALKGGTALNLFHFDLPRLSVDIDLNYIGAIDRNTMMAERPELEQRIRAIAGRQNLTLVRAPTGHAGSKWTFRYASTLGGGGSLEIDLNYLYRQPLWPTERLDSRALGPIRAWEISVLDIHELAGGKLAALFSRTAARDLFDAHHLLTVIHTDTNRLRQAFVLYGAMNRKDWRTITPDDIEVDLRDARRQLFPLLVQRELTRAKEQNALLEQMVMETREALSNLLPLVVLQPDNCGFSVSVAFRCKAPCAGNGRSPWQARQHGRRLRSQGFFRCAKTAMRLRLPCSGTPQERPKGWPVSAHGGVAALVKGYGHSLRAAPCHKR